MLHNAPFWISSLIILVCEIAYYKIATMLRIGSPVTPRSLHKVFTATGGGITTIVALICYYICWGYTQSTDNTVMLIGGLTLAIVSYCDDLRNLSPLLRLMLHVAVVAGVFHNMMLNGHIDYFVMILIFGVGIINAFNFMDGINGMLALYGCVVLSTLIYAINMFMPESSMLPLLALLLVSLLAFAIFNLRIRALLFCGDVGAITIGFFVAVALTLVIFSTSHISMLVFVAVFLVDTFFTIIQRLFAGEHILEPHRHHLYQVLTFKRSVPHLYVSAAYAAIQAAINVIWFTIPNGGRLAYAIVVYGVLTSIYFYLKRLRTK